MKRWLVNGILILMFMIPAPLSGGSLAAPVEPGLRVLRSNQAGIVLALDTPDYEILSAGSSGSARRSWLSVPGLEGGGGSGQSPLPYASALLAVPPGVDVRLQLHEGRSMLLEGEFDLPARLVPAPLEEALQPGEWMEAAPEMELSAAQDDPDGRGLFPAEPARIVEEAWLRDQRLVRVEIYPFRYDADLSALHWTPHLEVELQFTGVPSPVRSVQPGENPFEASLQQTVLNYESSLDWRAVDVPQSNPASPTVQAGESLGTRIKLVVDRDGLYRLTRADLPDLPSGADPRDFRLTSQGQDIAIHVTGESDGVFSGGDALYFFGQAFRGERMAARYAAEDDVWPILSGWQPHLNATMFEKYTGENVYWLTWGGPAGPRMGSLDASPQSGTPSPAYYLETIHREESNEWWSYHMTGEDTWLWNYLAPAASDTAESLYPVELSALASDPATATVRGEAVGHSLGSHQTEVLLNGVSLLESSWSGRTRQPFEKAVPVSSLIEGENQLHYLATAGLVSDKIAFDWFEIEYPRRFEARDDQLLFTHQAGGTRWKYEVGSLVSEQALVFDVTDPARPVRLLKPQISEAGGAFRAAFESGRTGEGRYLVAGASAVQTPKEVSLYNPPDLFSTSNGADYLFVTHGDFLAATQALADYRSAQGLRTRVVDAEDLYNEFNDGIFHPLAIKEFLRYAYANWQPPAPSFVLLVGDGHWNFKNYPGTKGDLVGRPNFMPPHLVFVDPWQGEVDSANLLANLVGDDILADVHIGRLPVETSQQVLDFLTKLQSYESSPPASWQRRVAFVADNPDAAGDFTALSDWLIANYVPGDFTPDRIYLQDMDCTKVGDRSCVQANYAITSTLNTTGALILNYIGHGAAPRWAGESIFMTTGDPAEIDDPDYNDLLSLDNAGQLPVVLSMTCLDGYWIHANVERRSLMVAMLREPGVGSISSFSPTGLGVATGHDLLDREFLNSLFQSGVWQLGPATAAGKLRLYQTGFAYDLIHTFTIFGDPALNLLSPYQVSLSGPVTAEIGGPGTSVDYSFQVTNTGGLNDTFAVEVSGDDWPASPSAATVGPLAPGASAPLTVTVQVPASALDGASDGFNLLVRSQGDRSKTAGLDLVTTADTSGVTLTPAADSRSAPPGGTAVYWLTAKNITDAADSFNVQLSGFQWAASADRSQIGPLQPGETAQVAVSVSVPPNAPIGAMDVVTVSVTSQTDPEHWAQATLVTRAAGMYLPLLRR